MREAIGGTWIFTIVIVFIVLFSSYLAISVNYSKAFKVKDSIISIIEHNEGLSSNAQEEIANYLSGIGYFVYGTCNSNKKGYEKSNTARKYKYCISKKEVGDSASLRKTYYKVRVFFRLDLPVIGDIFTFPVSGETKAVYFAEDAL